MKKSGGIAAVMLSIALTQCAGAQTISSYDSERAKIMLSRISADVVKHYYDPKLHGVDWDAKIRETNEKIGKVPNQNAALSQIAAVLDSLGDSHTYFVPPPRPYRHEYGWQAQMIGDHCYITRVKPKSDAEAKGIKPGDELLSVNGFVPTRQDMWRIQYLFSALRPQLGLRLRLRDLAGSERQVDVAAKITEVKLVGSFDANEFWQSLRDMEDEYHRLHPRFAEIGNDLLIVKVPEFVFTEEQANAIASKTRRHKAAILDLRGNPGGAVDSLQFLIGGVLGRDTKIGDRVGREARKNLVAKGGHDPFTGALVVLVDSNSASAAELFSRVVQLEHRGRVIGDRSSGSVMEAKFYSYETGQDKIVPYGASITDADLILADGKSLEHVGVTPDEISLPTAADLAAGRDPVLAHAAELLGVKLSAEDAGKIFPYQWPK